MEALPSGTVTFLFTDIEGSTKLAQEHPEDMPALLARHHEILHQVIQNQNGYVFQIIGDAFCAAFHSASDALKAALEAQRALQSEAWNPAPIKVRMGIHTGTAQLNDDNLYSGYATLATTQRIMSDGHGGQILISGSTRELVRTEPPRDSELIDLGEKRLKDLLHPEHLYQLNGSGLLASFPPLKTLDTYPNNLPVHLTSFIGREKEIAEVKQELGNHRLVTLTGSGGTGKTRLSMQVAAEVVEEFDHGVWFVELAPLADPDLIPQTILSSLGVKDQSGRDPLELLKTYLQEKKALIVLDNCEHLISASAQVVNALLRAAPKTKVLASSREALGVRGEVSYPVPSLNLPNVKNIPSIEGLLQYEAVRLFLDRALLVSPRFILNNDNALHIAQICHRLDGIPLAIELAAARVKVLSPEQITNRLDDRFRLLTGGARTALPRQQTLHALIDWSYDLLSENERLLLGRLSVFAGGWTLEAAEEVCAGNEIESFDVLDLLSQLVNKSLVVVEKSKSGETRYRMLETIRQYAREKLAETREGESIRDKHLAYFVKFAEQAEPELYRSNQVFWFHKLDDEIDNLRLALEWSLATNVEAGLQIAAALWRFWDPHGHQQEIENRLRQLLEQHETSNTLHAQSLAVHSSFIFIQGNPEEASRLAEHSLQMARALSDKQIEALTLYFLGMFNQYQGHMQAGDLLLEQSLALYRALGDKTGQANVLEALGMFGNDLKQSIIFLREGLELCRELGNLSGIAAILPVLARLTIVRGDFSEPRQWLDEALSISYQLGNDSNAAHVLSIFGMLYYWQGNYQRSIAYYEEASLLVERNALSIMKVWYQVHKSYAVLRQGDVRQAHKMFEDSIRRVKRDNWVVFFIFAIEGLASLYVNQDQPRRATPLFAWADMMREKTGTHRPPLEQGSVDKDLITIHSQVDDETFEKLWQEGSKFTDEEAIELALKEMK